MFRLAGSMILRQPGRWWLVTSGLAALTAGIVLIAAVSETASVVANQDLTQFWRTSYDILVRPPGARSLVEEYENLVEANHLSGIQGGITFEQYEAIRRIPDIEVAAPIAMLGYLAESIPITRFSTPPEGIYEVVQTVSVDNGATITERPYSNAFFYIGRHAAAARAMGFNVNPIQGLGGEMELPFLLAAVDPVQEAALVGLDQALVAGQYLGNDQPFSTTQSTDPFGNTITYVEGAPVLINRTSYISFTFRTELRRPLLPLEMADLTDMQAQGGFAWLRKLPSELVAVEIDNSVAAHQRLINRLLGIGPKRPGEIRIFHSFAYSIPSPIHYRFSNAPFRHESPVLEIVLPETLFSLYGEPAYRFSPAPELRNSEARFRVGFTIQAKGEFDIERLPRPADVNRVPLETYFPPVAKLLYDKTGRPVGPHILRPTLNPAGYIQSPPLLLTNLATARVIAGDTCISAIRIRVADIESLTPLAQQKIEAVATEIHRRTGLTVDVMVGSSPTKVMVHVPQLGYVEEEWIQKGVSVTFTRRLLHSQLLLLAIPIIIGVLFVLDLAWADVLSRYQTFALLKALGWRSSAVFAHILAQALLPGIMGASGGALAAAGVILGFGWRNPPFVLWIGVPFLVVGLCLIGSLYPAWLATQLRPILLLREITTIDTRRRGNRPRGLWDYAWLWLWRRAMRTLLSILAGAVATMLLVLLLGITLAQQSYLRGVLLGEYILVHIEGYHYAIAGLGFLLAAPLMGNNLLIRVIERRREIGVLKAVGWRSTTVARLFLIEGLVMGALSGLTGALSGLVGYLVLNGVFEPGLGWAVLVGLALAMIVGLTTAIYPARLAAAMPPSGVLHQP